MTTPLTAHLPQYPTNGDVIYKVVTNDGTPDAMMCLINAKNVFSAQLPKMPKEYITRLVLDRNHRTMVIQQQSTGRVIGGICYRPFPTQRFAEIVFCAVTSTEQGKGYGRLIMAYLKEHVKNEGIDYFLTYADNYAIKYFAKQAFTKVLTMHNDRWRNWIKDYDGATLMECGIVKEVNYITMNQTVRKQRAALIERIKNVSASHREFTLQTVIDEKMAEAATLSTTTTTVSSTHHPPDTMTDTPQTAQSSQSTPIFPLPLLQIPGVDKFQEQLQYYPAPKETNHDKLILTAKLSRILTALVQCPDSWPFRQPVDRAVVIDYYTVITHPMDLSTMQSKLNQGLYADSTLFEQDVTLVVHNCKIYNGPQTTYYRHAEDFWAHYVQLAQKFAIHQSPLSTSTTQQQQQQQPSNRNQLMGDETVVNVRLC